MKKTITAIVLGLGLLSAQEADAPKIVPITEEGHHHLVLENEYVKVFQVEVPAHGETLYHQHDRDYIFVTLGDSVVENVRLNETPVKLELKDGETRFTKGGFAHKAVNLSDKPFRNVTVELKKSPIVDQPSCELKEDKFGCVESSAAGEGISWREVSYGNVRVTCYGFSKPGRVLDINSNKKSLLIVDGEIDIRQRNTKLQRVHSGEIRWFNRPVKSIIYNKNENGSELVLIEF